MSEENKTVELKEDELSKASGGLIIGDPRTECVNFNEFIRNSNKNCCDRGKTKAQGAKYSFCSMCGQMDEITTQFF